MTYETINIPLERSALTLGGTDAPVLSDLSPQVLPVNELLQALTDAEARGVRRLLIRCESVGGDTGAALVLHDAIERYQARGGRVVVYVPEPLTLPTMATGIALLAGGFLGSAAPIWALGAKAIIMHPRSFLAIHGPCFEPSAEFRDPWVAKLVNFYARETLVPRGALEDWMKLDHTSLVIQSATAAVKHGLADLVGDEAAAVEFLCSDRPSPRRARLAARVAGAALVAVAACGGPEIPGPAPTMIINGHQQAFSIRTSYTFVGTRAGTDFWLRDMNEVTRPEPDTSYSVVATATAFTGSPNPNSFFLQYVQKNVDNVYIGLVNAPGTGNSVTFDIVVTGIRHGAHHLTPVS